MIDGSDIYLDIEGDRAKFVRLQGDKEELIVELDPLDQLWLASELIRHFYYNTERGKFKEYMEKVCRKSEKVMEHIKKMKDNEKEQANKMD
jgi:hypothetical protein